MRKAGPILIAVIGVLALIVCFAPNLSVPDASSPTGSRLIETGSGLDLQGGLRVEYQATADRRPGARRPPTWRC